MKKRKNRWPEELISLASRRLVSAISGFGGNSYYGPVFQRYVWPDPEIVKIEREHIDRFKSHSFRFRHLPLGQDGELRTIEFRILFLFNFEMKSTFHMETTLNCLDCNDFVNCVGANNKWTEYYGFEQICLPRCKSKKQARKAINHYFDSFETSLIAMGVIAGSSG